MEAEKTHDWTEQELSVQRTCFMRSNSSFSKRSFNPESDDLLYKFSRSKVIQVEEQEFVKRPLSSDQDMAVPFKKRKMLLEDSDNCDVSIDHNLQNNDSNERKDVTFDSKLEAKNFCEHTPIKSQKAHENQIDFNLQSSVFVKVEDSSGWIRLKCFESILEGSNNATFFAGGPIQCSSFCITPQDVKVNQYIAVAVSDVINNHSYASTKNTRGIIQFWNLGFLHKMKSLNQLPVMELALYHDYGTITEMKWCPANCYDKYPSTYRLPRLGLLAAASSDSCVYIYNIPQPTFMPQLTPKFPIYFTQPTMKLTPLFGGPSNVTMKTVTTSIEWEKNGERIAAGYGNGAICVWMIKTQFTLHIIKKSGDHSYNLQPYLFFQPSGTSITSLSFASVGSFRWLAVLSIDGFVRLFDLLDTSVPFKILKQGLEHSCVWSEQFCGVYTSPTLNSDGLVSLTATDCLTESLWDPKVERKDKELKLSRAIQKHGIFDSATHVTASNKGIYHAMADMDGTLIVNLLQNSHKSLETSYLSFVLFETEIVSLHDADFKLEASKSKIKISENALSNQISSVNDTKCAFNTETKYESSSSSSSSGFCSPNRKKKIVIEMVHSLADDSINLLKIPPQSSDLKLLKENHNNRMKTFLYKSLKFDKETTNQMIKSSESSEDLMRHLLMAKVENQSISSSHIPCNSSNNSLYCDSKRAKHLSLNTSPASSDTSDTIVYPQEDYYSDTSHTNALTFVGSNTSHENCDLNKKKIYGNFYTSDNLASKNCSNPSKKSCLLNYENKNSKKCDYFSSDHHLSVIPSNSFNSNDHHFTLQHSDIHKQKYHSKKSPEEVLKNENTFYCNKDTKSNFISIKDVKNLCKQENFEDPLCDVFNPNNLNHSEPFTDMYSSTTNSCDKMDHFSIRALNQSSLSDCSDDTIIYSLESNCDYVDCLNSRKLDAISQSLCDSQKENTFQDISLHKIKREAVFYESKLLKENCSSITKPECEHTLAKESLTCNSGYETGSATESLNLSEEDRSFDRKDILMSNFHLLHSEYSSDKSENELPQSKKDPQKLSYESLISSFGVIFKNSLDKSTKPLVCQKNNIHVEYNPLAVIKTISWDSNEGCQSWLFVGGDSGIGRLVFVPDSLADPKMNAGPSKKRKRKH